MLPPLSNTLSNLLTTDNNTHAYINTFTYNSYHLRVTPVHNNYNNLVTHLTTYNMTQPNIYYSLYTVNHR